MEKRVLLTMVLSIAIIAMWSHFFPAPRPPAPPPLTQPAAIPQAQRPATSSAPSTTANDPAAARPSEEVTQFERQGLYRAAFSSWGAAPKRFELLDPQYQEQGWMPKPGAEGSVRRSDDDPNWQRRLVPINLVRTQGETLPFAISSAQVAATEAWTLVRKSDDTLVYALDKGPLHLEKHWHLPREGYALGLTLTVEHRGSGDHAVPLDLRLHMPSWQDPSQRPQGIGFGRRYNLVAASCYVGGKLHHKTVEDTRGSSGFMGCGGDPTPRPVSLDFPGDVHWVGSGEPYFLVAAAFAADPAGAARGCRIYADPVGIIGAEANLGQHVLKPGQKVEFEMAAYLGPKLLNQLDAVRVGQRDPELGKTVDYNLEWVARPMLFVLKKIQGVVVNWGVAIILITILLKAITYYPTVRSMKSMRAMSALKPEMDVIRAKYSDDKNRQNQEVMELYRKHKINPLGGCLPMLIQMPIYLAFYSMLSNAVELYRASFFGPISDMTAPYWPLAGATGVLMFVQAKLSPQSPDSQQQQMMMYMMPVMFTLFTIFLPSGLTLYIFTNTVLTMVQQWYFNRVHPLPASVAKAR